MGLQNLPYFLANVLAAGFALAAILDLFGARHVRAWFHQRYPRRFYRVMGVLQLFTALFLAMPLLRIWGIMLAALLIFFWTVAFLNHRQWRWAATGMVLMLALVPASLAIN